jgi:hypothetical protein
MRGLRVEIRLTKKFKVRSAFIFLSLLSDLVGEPPVISQSRPRKRTDENRRGHSLYDFSNSLTASWRFFFVSAQRSGDG